MKSKSNCMLSMSRRGVFLFYQSGYSLRDFSVADGYFIMLGRRPNKPSKIEAKLGSAAPCWNARHSDSFCSLFFFFFLSF